MSIWNLYKKSFEGLSSQVWFLALMMLVNRMGSLILPFLTLYTTQELGWSKTESGFASASFGVGSLCGATIGGALVDRFGYWRMIVIGQIGAGVGFFMVMYLDSFYPLCIGLFLAAMIADVLRPAVMTGVGLITSQETRTRGISLMRLAFNLGYSIGPAMAGYIILWFSYKSIFVVDSLTCLMAGIFAILFINKDRGKQQQKPIITKEEAAATGPYRDGPFLGLMAASFLMLVAFFQLMFTVPLFMKEVYHLDEKAVGIAFAINGLLIVISEMPIVYLTEKKWKLMHAMILGTLLIGCGYISLMINLPAWYVIVIYIVFISYGEIVNFPFINSVSIRRTNPSNLGKYMGAISTLFSLSIIIAPIMGTQLISSFGYNTLWLCCGILCAISALCYAWVAPHFVEKDQSQYC